MEYKSSKGYISMIKETGWTVEEYYELPEDGNQYEMVMGKLELQPSPTTTHQRVSRRIERTLEDTCDAEYIIIHAPVDLIMTDRTIRQPDILMIHRSRESIIEERGIVGPPDLVVEILSPSTAKKDRTLKKEEYAKFGVPEYWVVDFAHQTIEQYTQMKPGKPYDLQAVYSAEEKLKSSRLTCVGFVVRDALTII
jgi:Uma2 family endonuclease